MDFGEGFRAQAVDLSLGVLADLDQPHLAQDAEVSRNPGAGDGE